MPHLPAFLGFLSLLTLSSFFLFTRRVFEDLSPQGCRMSWMSPSYVFQNRFDTSWSPLADRYSLLLYREVGWDPDETQGTPVLFIPGNAGSAHQVRSIASSATRQYYSSPFNVAPEFSSRGIKSLDFFAVEFNEDLSAFHGPTLESQISYTSRAISYILSLYPANTSLIVMGHSMGGVVATSLLPNDHISAIITMSTPHTLPPARFDSRIDKIYRSNQHILESDPTPILSLCGGATDMMIPSESCVLPNSNKSALRRTVFTSALEGAWTGVGHREMVWCHQVRSQVARAALEITPATTHTKRARVLDVWLRDGQELPFNITAPTGAVFDPSKDQIVGDNGRIAVVRPQGSSLHLAPIPSTVPASPSSMLKAVIFIGLGSIAPSPSHSSYPLRASVLLCTRSSGKDTNCNSLKPSLLRIVPNPEAGNKFPLPEQGADEAEGVGLFEADLPVLGAGQNVSRWLGVRIEGADGRGWVYGGISVDDEVTVPVSMFSLLTGNIDVMFPKNARLRSRFVFPNALSSALVVYKYTPLQPKELGWCSEPLLSPVIMHSSQPMETHYFPINAPDRRILLHTHSSAPYIPVLAAPQKGFDFVIYSTGLGCNMPGFSIGVDWPATLGRLASRYPTTLVTWSLGVVGIVLFSAWGAGDRGAAIPSVGQSLRHYSRRTLGKLLLASALAAVLPIPADYYLGTRGEIFFAPIAPLLLLISSGLVCVSWGLLVCLTRLLGLLQALVSGRSLYRPRRQEDRGVSKSTVISMAFIFVMIFLFVPWQVAYLGCWVIHLYSCASSQRHISLSSHLNYGVSTVRFSGGASGIQEPKPEDDTNVTNHEAQRTALPKILLNNHNHAMHLLLLMTWLLPLAAPVLAVWVRTLATAGLTTPFDGDHNFLNVAPFLVLVDFTSWNSGKLFERHKFENLLSLRWCWAVLAATAVFVGPRQAYSTFDAAKIAVGLAVVIGIGRRYWGGASTA